MDQISNLADAVKDNLKQVRYKLLVMSGKGGVGKSSFAVNVSKALELRGYKVGLLDIDLHGPDVMLLLGLKEEIFSNSKGRIVPIKATENLKVLSLGANLSDSEPVIWRGPLKISAIKQFLSDVEWGNLDFLIVDSPPGTGDEPLTVMQFLGESLTGAIVISTPQEVALLDTKRSISFARKLNVPILGVVENMSYLICPSCGEKMEIFSSRGAEKLSSQMGVDILGKIPFSLTMVKKAEIGKTIWDEPKDELIVKAYDELIEKLLKKLSS